MSEVAGAAEHTELSESLSLAMVELLASLSPIERVVYLLRDGFGYGYGDIAAAVGESAADCLRIFTRARSRLKAGRPCFPASRTARCTGEGGAGD
jgi:DNA-directed RNA polymerase specialized sigma24 family protein